jgi:hypothetical protein
MTGRTLYWQRWRINELLVLLGLPFSRFEPSAKNVGL